MLKKITLSIFSLLLFISGLAQSKISKYSAPKIIEENKTIEAENFISQTANSEFKWFKFTRGKKIKIKNDIDKPHYTNCSNNSFIEILPLKKVPKKPSANKTYFPQPGKSAIIKYKVNFKNSGRFYVWVRGFSNHKYDNSIHVGIDGKWPQSGVGLYWCSEKEQWSWSNQKRINSDQCNQKPQYIYIDVKKPGIHTIEFSMREYGLEIDKFMLTNKKGNKPS